MSGQFWIRSGQGAHVGPFDAQQIRGFVQSGQLTATMDISKDGVSWINAAKVKGLFPPPPPVEIDDFSTPPAPVFSAPPTPTPAPRPNAGPPPIYASAPTSLPPPLPAASPQANANAGSADPGLLSQLVHVKTVWLWFLSMATFGIYLLLWLYRNARTIEQVTKAKLTGDAYILWMAFLLACNIATRGSDPQDAYSALFILLLNSITGLALFIMLVVWAYKAKRALESYAREQLGIHWHLNAFWTFIFNIFYINYCINDLPDAYRRLGGR